MGENVIEILTSGNVTDEYLNQIENNLKKIKEESIKNDNNSSKLYNSNTSFLPKKKYKDPVLNAIYNKQKLKKDITDNQYHYKEYPRGWVSSKDYFINNITNENKKIEKSPLKIMKKKKMKKKKKMNMKKIKMKKKKKKKKIMKKKMKKKMKIKKKKLKKKI